MYAKRKIMVIIRLSIFLHKYRVNEISETHFDTFQEPHGSGPLFCELNFYQRAAKPETGQ